MSEVSDSGAKVVIAVFMLTCWISGIFLLWFGGLNERPWQIVAGMLLVVSGIAIGRSA